MSECHPYCNEPQGSDRTGRVKGNTEQPKAAATNKNAEAPPHKRDKATQASNKRKADKRQEHVHRGRVIKGNIQEPVLVYVLGTITNQDGREIPQLDLYSGINGLIVRTIPGRRWSNPVLVGATGGTVAIVDRFGDRDLIRVTDDYGGAPPDTFDSDDAIAAFPWESVPDINRIEIPGEYTVTGVQITEEKILVATLFPRSGEAAAQPVYLAQDLEGYEVYSDSNLHGVDGFGSAIGKPSAFNLTNAGRFKNIAYGSVTSDGRGYVSLGRIGNPKFNGGFNLPQGMSPVTVVVHGGFLNVLCRTSPAVVADLREYSPEAEYAIVRFKMMDVFGNGSAYRLRTQTALAKPENDLESEVADKSYDPKDSALPADGARYSSDEAGFTEAEENVSKGRNLSEGKTRKELNEDREQELVEKPTGDYLDEVEYAIVSIPQGSGLIDIDNSSNTIVELYRKFGIDEETGEPTEEINPLDLIFRLVHGIHYDYLGDGGYSYQCEAADGSTSLMTNGIRAMSVAATFSPELGQAKDLPDVKATLVDSETGLLVFCPKKPTGYKFYGGRFHALAPVDGNKVKRSACSLEQERWAETIDGLDRTDTKTFFPRTQNCSGATSDNGVCDPNSPIYIGDVDYAAAFTSTQELEEPWSYFQRRVLCSKFTPMKLNELSFSTKDPTDPLGALTRQEWIDSSESFLLIRKNGSQGHFFYPRNPRISPAVQSPSLTAVAASGFFVPDVKRVRSNWISERNKELTAMQAQLAALQALVVELEGRIEAAPENSQEQARLQARLDRTNASIASIQNDSEALEQSIASATPQEQNRAEWVVSDAVKSTTYNIERTESPQRLQKRAVIVSEPFPGPAEAGAPLQAVQVGEGIRGARVETGPKTWIGLCIALDRMGILTDVPSAYPFESYHVNRLGERQQHVSFAPGHAFFTGSTLYQWGVGDYPIASNSTSRGSWELEVFADGVPIDTICTRIFTDQDLSLAPQEMQSQLNLSLNYTKAVNPNLGYAKGKVYYSDKLINEVTVVAKLWVHHRNWIKYRWGMYDMVNGRTSGQNGPILGGTDPGFYTCFNSLAVGVCHGWDTAPQEAGLSDEPNFDGVLWEGRVTFKVANDPYQPRGILMGRYFDCVMEFDMKDNAVNYVIPRR